MKTCRDCGETKPFNEFYKDKKSKDGYRYECKQCSKNDKKGYGRCKEGMITIMYNRQRQYSLERNHPMPEYTKEELRWWLFSQQTFNKLYDEWAESHHRTNLKPSIDRLDSNKPYSFDNIQLVTWQENSDNFVKELKSGKYVSNNNNSRKKPINQFDLNGNLIKRYESISSMNRETGYCEKNVRRACNASNRTAYGFRWKLD